MVAVAAISAEEEEWDDAKEQRIGFHGIVGDIGFVLDDNDG